MRILKYFKAELYLIKLHKESNISRKVRLLLSTKDRKKLKVFIYNLISHISINKLKLNK